MEVAEIIVYLDDHSVVSENGTWDLWLDFRTEHDLLLFIDALTKSQVIKPHDGIWGKKSEILSYVHLTGLYIKKRLIRGRYYALNVGTLSYARLDNEDETDISLLTFDCSQINSEIANYLLGEHLPLEPIDIGSVELGACREMLPNYHPDGPMRLLVADVGQANMNFLLDGDSPFFVFDLGAPINSSRCFIRQIISNYIDRITNPCTLVISHWDVDHYQCLRQMSTSEISQKFQQVVCTNQCKSLMSQRILEKLRLSLPGRVFCFNTSNRPAHSPYPALIPFYSDGFISLYIGEHSSNINICGINAFVCGNLFSVQFTGDCLLKQADDVLQNEYLKRRLQTDHILIVPHHGGKSSKVKVPLAYNTSSIANCNTSIISVGKHNGYGHPEHTVMSFIAGIFKHNIHLTSLYGDFTCNI